MRLEEGRRKRLEFYQVTVADARDRLNMHTATQPIHVVRKSKLRSGTRNRCRGDQELGIDAIDVISQSLLGSFTILSSI